jgi:hypothetical protein
LLIEYLFRAFGWIPDRPGNARIRNFLAVRPDFALIMAITMLALTAALYRIVRSGTLRTRRRIVVRSADKAREK